jgi:hypothetical protein
VPGDSVSGGARLERGDWPGLLALLLAGCLALGAFALVAHRFTDGQGGVPLDDAWIHFQFARNLARGDGLSFNPGEPTSGSTAPLWTLLLAAVYRAGGRFPVAGQLLSGACFLATLVTTWTLGKRITASHWAGWLAGVIVAVNGRMIWAGLSALETCLFAALSLLAIRAHLDDRAAGRYRLRTAALFGLAASSRPEGYLLFALAMIDFVVHAASAGLQVGWRRLPWGPVGLFALIVLPYLVFSLRTGGHLLPNTYHAKASVDFSIDLDVVSVAARYLILDNPLLLPFFVLGIGVLLRRAPLLSLWSVGLPLVYALLHAALYQHGRYLIPLIPCNAVVAVAGLEEARRLALRRGWPWASPLASAVRGRAKGRLALVTLLAVAGTAWRLPTMANLYAWNVDNINHMHVAIGRWAAEHTPPGAILALNDIGAITYVSERRVVDLAGLVTPEVVPLLRSPDRDALLAGFMAERGVEYVVILPNWFPGLAARDDVLEPIHQVTLQRNTIVGGETMVVYRTHW